MNAILRISVVAVIVAAVGAGMAATAAEAAKAPPPPKLGARVGTVVKHPRKVKKVKRIRHVRGGDDDGPSTTASLTTPLYYHAGGYVQPSPRIYIVYWGNWSGDQYGVMQRLYWFYRSVGGSGWNQTQTQFGMNCIAGTTSCTSSSTMIRNTQNQLRNWVQDTSTPPATPTEADIAAEARWASSYFRDEGYEAQFVIALPPGHRDAKSLANGWCAWHNYSRTVSGNYISYTSMPYLPDQGTTCGMNRVNSGTTGLLDGISIYAGHEYAESETDPFLNAWLDSANAENADKCLQYQLPGYFRNVTFSPTGMTFAVQPLWSTALFLASGGPCTFWS